VKATPKPRRWTTVRFEDFVLKQDETLKKLAEFLGFPLVKIPVNPEPVGRWKTDKDSRHDFPFFRDDLIEFGYVEKKDAAKRKPAKRRGRAVAV
jgi:hypothetical protein